MEGQDEHRNRSHGRWWVEIRENGVWTTGSVVIWMETSFRVLYHGTVVPWGWVPKTLTSMIDKKMHSEEWASIATVHCSASCLSQCRLGNIWGSTISVADDSVPLLQLLLERKTNIFLKMEIERLWQLNRLLLYSKCDLDWAHFWQFISIS